MLKSVHEDDLVYAADIYNVEQVKPHAEACAAGRCSSYIHCFFGRPRGDNGTPLPVCAQSILAMLEAAREIQ